MKRYFVTGTDTDCGKTYVTRQLVHHLKHHAKRAVALKPVASGLRELDGVLQNEDVYQYQLLNASYEVDESSFWRFNQPISPHLAALSEGHVIGAKQIALACQNAIKEDVDYVLIEGAGGLMAPLNHDETWVDFLLLTQIPVILVVGMRLGCLNHALLTYQVLAMHGIECSGWIANCIDDNMQSRAENITSLSTMLPIPLITRLPFQGSLESMDFNI